jgi:hypothetical protein
VVGGLSAIQSGDITKVAEVFRALKSIDLLLCLNGIWYTSRYDYNSDRVNQYVREYPKHPISSVRGYEIVAQMLASNYKIS